MRVRPITLRAANAYVAALHRHHTPSRGHKFSVSVVDDDGEVRGVAIVGRPVARGFDPEAVAEVTRVCTDGTPNACSMLYGAARRICREMGYQKIITYTLSSEPGTSLRGAGWKVDGEVRGRPWSCPTRPREDVNPTDDKIRWIG
jgi:hypothetical protein